MQNETKTETEKVLLNVIPGDIEQNDAYGIVSKYSENYNVQVQKKIYYPYFWVLFEYTIKTLFGKSREIKASCLVDLINNHGATTDKFDYSATEILKASVLEPDYTEEQALKTARSYLMHSSVHNTKVLFAPDSTAIEQSIVYKPFWIVKCTSRERHNFKVLVDGVTGKFQLL